MIAIQHDVMWVQSWFNLVATPVGLFGWALLSMNEIALKIMWLKWGFVLVMVGVKGNLIWIDKMIRHKTEHASWDFYLHSRVQYSYYYRTTNQGLDFPPWKIPSRPVVIASSYYSYATREIRIFSIHSRQAHRCYSKMIGYVTHVL